MVIKLRHKLDYLLVFLLICCSGNPLFISVSNTQIYYIILSIFVLLIVSIKHINFFSHFMKYMSLFFMIYLLQLATLKSASFSSIGFMIIKTFIGCAIFFIVGDRFSVIYIRLMSIICLISIVFYLYTMRFGLLPGVLTSDHTISLGFYTELLTQDNHGLNRNSGLFWEPGAFQAYINIAIALMMLKEKFTNSDFLYLLLFIVTIITTSSTTGFLLLGLNLIYFVSFKIKLSPFLRIIAIISTICICAYFYFNVDFLHEKIYNQTTFAVDQEGRINDIRRLSHILFDNFFLGTSYIEIWTGNGFMSNLLHLGIIGACYFYIMFYRNIKKYNTNLYSIYFFVLIILSLQGEVLLMYPFYLALPFAVFKLMPLKHEEKFYHNAS